MPDDSPTSIVDRFRRPSHKAVAVTVFLLVLAAGILGAVHVARADLTLSHYDARAHLVVPRRIVDSLTPGWRQIGAVWLPLPHLLSLPFIGWDWAYRTGIPSVALSIIAMGCGLASLAAFLHRRTHSLAAAAAAPAVIVLNPNVLYLTATPMTEPLLFGLALVALSRVDRWITEGTRASKYAAMAAIAALALTRYEGWLIAGALVAWAGIAQWRRGLGAILALTYPLAGAVAGFLVLGWATTGVWFVSTGFFAHDPTTYKQLGATLEVIWRSTLALGSPVVIWTGLAGIVVCLVERIRQREGPAMVTTLLAAAALPLFAFYEGHPHRVRYMVPLVVAAGALAGVVIARLPVRLRVAAAVALVATALWQQAPLNPVAPMVTEAQWETPFRRGREIVTATLRRVHDGTPILASMGSLGHYMQEASHARFDLADFLHEGNGDLWAAAIAAPERHVRWILIEEQAEGGDEIARRARSDERYLARFTRLAAGGGLALYQREP